MTVGARQPRRRRAPEEAESEILEAAERVIRADPGGLTVTAVMAETTLTRNAFYVYFEDVYDLITRLIGRLRAGADAGMDAFVTPGSDSSPAGREALAAAARLYADHGELLRALATAAEHDPDAARVWADFAEPSYAAVLARVKQEVKAGQITGIDPERTVRALIAMNRACFFAELVGVESPDVDAVVDALHEIWIRALYGSPAGRRRRSPRRTG